MDQMKGKYSTHKKNDDFSIDLGASGSRFMLLNQLRNKNMLEMEG
jgi:hypothetical protein